jgi:hypothetical protein
MEPANLKNLMERVKIIARGRQAALLHKLIDMLYYRERRTAEKGGVAGREIVNQGGAPGQGPGAAFRQEIG